MDDGRPGIGDDRALAKNAEQRLATAGELASALTGAAQGRMPNGLRARAARIQTESPWRTADAIDGEPTRSGRAQGAE
jgi:hypothetical protein